MKIFYLKLRDKHAFPHDIEGQFTSSVLENVNGYVLEHPIHQHIFYYFDNLDYQLTLMVIMKSVYL